MDIKAAFRGTAVQEQGDCYCSSANVERSDCPRRSVLLLLVLLLLLFLSLSPAHGETLSASLYDPGAALDRSPLYGHEIFYEKVGNLFTAPVLFARDLQDPYTVYYGSRDLVYSAGFIGKTGDYVEEIVECVETADFFEDEEYARAVLTPSYVTDGPFRWRTFNDFSPDPDKAPFHRELDYYVSFGTPEEETLTLDGHPALLTLRPMYDDLDIFSGMLGSILYARNDTALLVSFITSNSSGGITMDDLRAVARLIAYDGSNAAFLAEDGGFTLATEDGESYAFSGTSKALAVTFTRPERFYRKIESVFSNTDIRKNAFLTWSVLDAETKEPVPGVSVDAQNVLHVKKGLTDVIHLEITAEAAVFHTKVTLPLTVYPAVAKIIPDRSELFLYAGTGTPETVKISLVPEGAPPVGITWTARRSGIVSIAPGGGGSAVFSPVAPGSTPVTIAAPSGKIARLNVQVVEPVQQVDLTLSGRPFPGGRVAVKAALLPQAAADKRLEWSLDVDAAIASISNRGIITISNLAAPGTKIVAACKALGAPEPVLSTLEFEVIEK